MKPLRWIISWLTAGPSGRLLDRVTKRFTQHTVDMGMKIHLWRPNQAVHMIKGGWGLPTGVFLYILAASDTKRASICLKNRSFIYCFCLLNTMFVYGICKCLLSVWNYPLNRIPAFWKLSHLGERNEIIGQYLLHSCAGVQNYAVMRNAKCPNLNKTFILISNGKWRSFSNSCNFLQKLSYSTHAVNPSHMMPSHKEPRCGTWPEMLLWDLLFLINSIKHVKWISSSVSDC